jgi:hypothetical protein
VIGWGASRSFRSAAASAQSICAFSWDDRRAHRAVRKESTGVESAQLASRLSANGSHRQRCRRRPRRVVVFSMTVVSDLGVSGGGGVPGCDAPAFGTGRLEEQLQGQGHGRAHRGVSRRSACRGQDVRRSRDGLAPGRHRHPRGERKFANAQAGNLVESSRSAPLAARICERDSPGTPPPLRRRHSSRRPRRSRAECATRRPSPPVTRRHRISTVPVSQTSSVTLWAWRGSGARTRPDRSETTNRRIGFLLHG